MHYSAKRGLAIACRPSVCMSVRPSVHPSVKLVDQEGGCFSGHPYIGRIAWSSLR